MKVGFGQPWVTRAPAAFTGVEVAPDGECIERDVGERIGFGDAVSLKHRRQMVAVASAGLGVGTLALLPVVLGGPRSVGEVEQVQLLRFLIHALEDGMSAPSCRTSFTPRTMRAPTRERSLRVRVRSADLVAPQGESVSADNPVDFGPRGV